MPAAPLSAGASVRPAPTVVSVPRWPSEQPLFVASLFVSLVCWVVLLVSVIGILYAGAIGLFIFFAQALFIGHIRGSGVRIGPDQLPELHARVQTIAERIGLERVPDVYLMQAGGTLNALATRFLGRSFVVLYSDLLDACGDDRAAADMIIAHELGHVKAGHLRRHLWLLPASVIPFLGSAYSRACEYTCDRFGLVGAGDREGALLGLTVLAAGGSHARRVNLDALARQRADLNTGWMRIAEWLSSHPPLARRIAALDPSLGRTKAGSAAGTVRALIILLSAVLLLTGMVRIGTSVAGWLQGNLDLASASSTTAATPAEAGQALQEEFDRLASFLDGELAEGRALPASSPELYERWGAANPGEIAPIDPYDGDLLGFAIDANGSYLLWSSGPDATPGTRDDITYESGVELAVEARR